MKNEENTPAQTPTTGTTTKPPVPKPPVPKPPVKPHFSPGTRQTAASLEAEQAIREAELEFRRRQREDRNGKKNRFQWLGALKAPLKIVAVLLFLSLSVLFFDGSRRERKELTAVFAALSGKVSVVKRMEKKPLKATLKTALANRDVDITGSNGKAVIVFPDGSAVQQEPSTRFEIRLLDYARSGRRDRSFFLRYGTVFARISKYFGAGGQTLIATPNAVAAARGTGFTVSYTPAKEKTVVEVTHGKVEFRNAGGKLMLTPGQRGIAFGDNPPVLSVVGPVASRRMANQFRRLSLFEIDPNFQIPIPGEGVAGNAAAPAGGNAAAAALPTVNIDATLADALASANNNGVPAGGGNAASAAARDNTSNAPKVAGTGKGPLAAIQRGLLRADRKLAAAEKKFMNFSSPLLDKLGLTVKGWNLNATNAAHRAATVQALRRVQEGIASLPGDSPDSVNPVTLDGTGLDAEARERVLNAISGEVLESYKKDGENGYIVRARAKDDMATLYELTEEGVKLIPEARNAGKTRIEEEDDLTPGAEDLKKDLENATKKK